MREIQQTPTRVSEGYGRKLSAGNVQGPMEPARQTMGAFADDPQDIALLRRHP
jgi:hypothetical protein